jgi:transposase
MKRRRRVVPSAPELSVFSRYPSEIRAEAVRVAKSSDRPLGEIARSLGVEDSILADWMQSDRAGRTGSGDQEDLSPSERNELECLRKEVIDLRSEREILRKAAVIIARESTT